MFGLFYIKPQQNQQQPLTFIAEEANSTIKMMACGDDWPVIDGLQYRTNINAEWNVYTFNNEGYDLPDEGLEITLTNAGDYVQFKNTNNELTVFEPWGDDIPLMGSISFINFIMSGKIAASGNIQSLLNYSDSVNMFEYYHMFDNCTSLTQAPELPAINLSYSCYRGMFYGCTSLTQAPELLARNLAERCYEEMFRDCLQLSSITINFTEWAIPTIWSDGGFTGIWLDNVASTGTFRCPNILPEIYNGDRIPEGWTKVDI